MRSPPPISAAPRYPSTAGLILLAVGVSVARFAKVDVSALYTTVAVERGEVWRLVTSALPHGSVLHLAFNVYWVWVFGSLIEERWGHWKTAALFVFLAAGSMAAEFAVLDGGIGLSGVGYGLFGLLWALSRRGPDYADAIDSNTTVLFVVWFFLCIGATVTKMMPVANVAHGVGALLGGLLGFAVSGPRTPRGWRVLAASGAAAVVAASLAGATVARPWVNFAFDRGLDQAYLGSVALGEGRNEDALRWCRESVRMKPGVASYWFNLAIAYDQLGDRRHAAAAFERASQLDPGDVKFKVWYERSKEWR